MVNGILQFILLKIKIDWSLLWAGPTGTTHVLCSMYCHTVWYSQNKKMFVVLLCSSPHLASWYIVPHYIIGRTNIKCVSSHYVGSIIIIIIIIIIITVLLLFGSSWSYSYSYSFSYSLLLIHLAIQKTPGVIYIWRAAFVVRPVERRFRNDFGIKWNMEWSFVLYSTKFPQWDKIGSDRIGLCRHCHCHCRCRMN